MPHVPECSTFDFLLHQGTIEHPHLHSKLASRRRFPHQMLSLLAFLLLVVRLLECRSGGLDHRWYDTHSPLMAAPDTLSKSNGRSNSWELSVSVTEYEALEDLFLSTNGSNWWWRDAEHGRIWNFSSPNNDPCTQHWQGINCTYIDVLDSNSVVAIVLPNYNLVGTLPPSLANIPFLNALVLPLNWLSGTLPTTMPNLRFLETMVLQSNVLTGPFPAMLGSMNSLRHLLIGLNNFTGTIPPELGNLNNLTLLVAGNNPLHGTIPPEITHLRSLRLLDFYHCHLTGTLPSALGNMSSIMFFNVYNNSLSGPIPESFGTLSSMRSFTLALNKLTGTVPVSLGALEHLQYIDLYSNQLTGAIPESFSDLDSLQILYLNSNKLHGSMDVLCGLRNISQLYLSNNALSGTIPACLGAKTALKEIYFDLNQLTGSLPDMFGGLPNLLYLVLDSNHLTSTIPASVGTLQQLTTLQLFQNHLSGTVPASFAGLNALNLLQLQNNMFTGPITQMFNASVQRALQIVLLNSNQFTGPIPDEPFRGPVFSQLSAVDNCLHGSIPDTVCQCESLNILALDGMGAARSCRSSLFPGISRSYISRRSALDGSIPPCLFRLPNLTTLHLSGTDAEGSLPYDLELGPWLIDLALSHNRLSGAIPRAIQQRKWYNLDLSYNRFTSTLQSSFNSQPVTIVLNTTLFRVIELSRRFVSKEAHLNIENNRLSGEIPDSVQTLPDIRMLDGNLFECRLDESDLPANDEGRSGYQCGSDSFNPQYYLWLAAMLVCAVVAGTVRRWGSALMDRLPWVVDAVRTVQVWRDAPHHPEVVHRLQHFHYVDNIARVILVVAVISTVFITVLLAPIYVALSDAFTTITFKYAWTVSAMFLSGATPFAVVFVLLLLLLALVIQSAASQVQRVLRREETAALRREASSESLRSRLDSAPATVTRQQVYSAYAAFFVVSFVTVLGVNVAFVYMVLYGHHSYLRGAQVLVALFKGFWNSVGSVMVLRWAFSKFAYGTATADYQNTLLFASLMSNIAIPCLVIASISPDCFYNVFIAPPAVTYKYAYLQCVIFLFDKCMVNYPRVSEASFRPPFTYSYECAAQYVLSYAPTFVILALEVSFLQPAMQAFRAWLFRRARRGTRWHAVLAYTTAQVLQLVVEPAGQATARDKFYLCYDANLYLVQLMTYFGVLITFGAIFPPLAPTMLCAIASLIVANRLIVGRYITSAREQRALHLVDNVNKDCRSVGSKHIKNLKLGVWMLIFFASTFYALPLFDILGDERGLQGAYWVMLLLPALPVAVYAVEARWG